MKVKIGLGKPSIGILGLHGLGGTPANLEPFIKGFRKSSWKSFLVSLPTLPGFDRENWEQLKEITYQEWITASRQAYHNLRLDLNSTREKIKKIFIIGYSMGGLLAIIEAAFRRDDETLAGLILINPAIKEQNPWGWVLGTPVLRQIGKQFISSVQIRGTPYQRDESEQTLPYVPTETIIQLKSLQDLALKQAPLVRCPTLIIQGEKDETVKPSGAWELALLLNNERVEIQLVKGCDHYLTNILHQNMATKVMLNFINTIDTH